MHRAAAVLDTSTSNVRVFSLGAIAVFRVVQVFYVAFSLPFSSNILTIFHSII